MKSQNRPGEITNCMNKKSNSFSFKSHRKTNKSFWRRRRQNLSKGLFIWKGIYLIMKKNHLQYSKKKYFWWKLSASLIKFCTCQLSQNSNKWRRKDLAITFWRMKSRQKSRNLCIYLILAHNTKNQINRVLKHSQILDLTFTKQSEYMTIYWKFQLPKDVEDSQVCLNCQWALKNLLVLVFQMMK